MKPTKEEMLKELDTRFLIERPYAPEIYCALRVLIEKYGDGGPRVKADEMRRMIQDAYEEVGGEGISYKVLFNWLRSIGVEVEE